MTQIAQSVADLAASPKMKAALDWFRRERAWINEQHLKLCRIPAPTFLEAKRAEWMAERFRSLGWEAKLDRAGNVVASLPGKSSTPAIAVTAHLDTVFAPRTPEDIKVSSEGRFHGPGVCDNGAGLAALLALAAAWVAGPPVDDSQLTLVLIANVGEEGEGNLSGMRYLCRASNGSSVASKARAFLVLDGPGTDRITSRALASRRFDVTFSGPGGHSWSDYGVGNPVHALSRAISLFTDRAVSELEGDAKSSFNFGLIEGGSSINSIPDAARAKVDLRSEDAEQIEQMAAILASSVERALEVENGRAASVQGPAPAAARSAKPVAAKLKEIGSRPGGQLPEDSPLLDCLRAADAYLGIRSHLDCSSTDANIPLSLGLPAVAIGAGGQGGGAHTTAEWYQPDGRDLGLRRVMLAMCLLLVA